MASITNNFTEQLKSFIVSNNVIGTTAGVCIGIVTKDVITSLVGDVIIPGIILMLLSLNLKSLTNIFPGKTTFDFTNFFKQFISWIFIIIITFIFIKYAFQRLLGISDKATEPSADTTKDKPKETFLSYQFIHYTDQKEK